MRMFGFFLVYILVVSGIYCIRKGLNTKRTNYSKEADSVLENFFFRFQKAIRTFDNDIYRSDKAYPILTQPLINWIQNNNHSLQSFHSWIPKFKNEWNYLEQLVGKSLGTSPFLNYRVKKRARFLDSIEKVLWALLGVLSLGARIIRMSR